MAEYMGENGNHHGIRPSSVQLSIPYPNPFFRSRSKNINIMYALDDAMVAYLTVENIVGDVVCVIMNESQSVGFHEVSWNTENNDGTRVDPGVYIFHLTTSTDVSLRRLFEIYD